MKQYHINNPHLKLDIIIDSSNEDVELEIMAYLNSLEASLMSNQITMFVKGQQELTKKLLAGMEVQK